jgi:hypothetical protein
MLRYFVAGNGWLLMAFLLYVGKTADQPEPTRLSFFGVGQSFQPHEYWAIIAVPTAASLLYFVMYAISARKDNLKQVP